MMLKTSKFALNRSDKVTVHFMRNRRVVAKSKMHGLTSDASLRLPFLVRLGPRNTFVSGCVSLVFDAIGLILGSGTFSQF